MTTSITALTARPPAYTPLFTYIRGTYRIGNESLPYFATTLPVKEAVRFLVLPRDVVFDPTKPVPLDELFQRELEEERAERQIVPYLRRPGQTKFFNSLTVALLPVADEGTGRLAERYPESDGSDAPPLENLELKQIGPVRLYRAGDGELGHIQWNSSRAQAVILDGQHRFYSLKSLLESDDYAHKAELADTDVPVLLLVPDERVGFRASGPSPSSVLKVCRAIFIDLNKHAKPVSKARQYLLDDRDVMAVSMRAIMSDATGGSSDGGSAVSRVVSSSRLPLGIVDWHSGSAKFDTGYYVTTVLNLYDFVDAALNLPAFKSEDYESAEKYIDRLTARLDLPREQRQSLLSWKNRCELDQVPFELREEDIASAAGAFRSRLGFLVAGPLVLLKPYRELIEKYESLSLVGGRHETWLALDNKGKRAYEKEMDSSAFVDQAAEVAAQTKDKYPDAFQVVFQKGFVRALLAMEGARESLASLWRTNTASTTEYVQAWCRRFNEVVAPTLVSDGKQIWLGAGRSEDRIDFTQRGQRAIVGFVAMLLIAPTEDWKAHADETDRRNSIRSWLRQDMWGKIKQGPKADPLDALISSIGKHYRDGVERLVVAQASVNRQDLSPRQKDSRMESFVVEILMEVTNRCHNAPGDGGS